MKQPTLFGNDPALKMRDSRGRYATADRAYADKAIRENKFLRHEVEKYRRSYLAAGELASMYHRELLKVKEQLKELQAKMNSYGNEQ